jgi:integrase
VPVNPCAGVERCVNEEERERALSEAEIKVFWEGLDKAPTRADTHARDILKLALLSGQRLDEICGAHIDEFDFTKKTWTIPKLRTKPKRDHTLPMPPLMLTMFKAAFERSGGAYAFPGLGKLRVKAVNPGSVLSAWRRARDSIGLGDVRANDLRRSMATQLGELGFSDFEIGLVLNHARAGVTSVYNRNGYGEPKLHMLSKWVARLSAILEGREPETNVVRPEFARKA